MVVLLPQTSNPVLATAIACCWETMHVNALFNIFQPVLQQTASWQLCIHILGMPLHPYSAVFIACTHTLCARGIPADVLHLTDTHTQMAVHSTIS